MSAYRPYPKTKPSGVDWLGEVPEGWCVARIKWSTVACQNGIWGEDPKGDDNDLPCVRVADFDRGRLSVFLDQPTIRNVPKKDRSGRLINKGDLLIEKSGGGENQLVGCVVIFESEEPAVCSNFVAGIAAARDMHSSFWRYVHAAAYSVRLNFKSIKQTSGIQNLDSTQYLNELCVFPPLPEQIQIASFLDRECGKLDALQAKQQRLIELLKEKRQALISHAVTRGLDPTAKLKPSGIEWLGDVPVHWAVPRLAYRCVRIGDGLHGTPEYVDESPYIFINGNNLADGKISLKNSTRCVSEAEFKIHQVELNESSLLMSINGTIGSLALYQGEKIILGKSAAYINCGKGLTRTYLFYFFQSPATLEFLHQEVTGTTIFNLSLASIRKLSIPVPPLAEQRAIVAHLDEKCGKIDQLKAKAERGIELLKERRSALISAAVTGKIDVRDM